MIINNGLKTWKEAVVAYFKTLHQCLTEGAKERHERPQFRSRYQYLQFNSYLTESTLRLHKVKLSQ
jgi:hypothetical protein